MKFTKEQQEWIDSRPKRVQKVIYKVPPVTCYKSKTSQGHYVLYSYDEEKGGKISVRVNHLDDSFLPGHQVFGYDPDDLIACGCLLTRDRADKGEK